LRRYPGLVAERLTGLSSECCRDPVARLDGLPSQAMRAS
jgi:hypothetical protein